MRILIADDESISRNLLEGILHKLGHEVVSCRDGEEAWANLKVPDGTGMVILDWMMPGMDGLEVIKRIRRERKDTYIYAVLLTSRVSEDDINRGFSSGVDDYLPKPMDPGVLIHRLRVAERILSYEAEIRRQKDEIGVFMNRMKELAEERARQLVHADRMATLGTLSAGIAHEITNPATFIAGNIQTLDRGMDIFLKKLHERGIDTADDPQISFMLEELPRMISGMKNGVDRINSIVSALKSYARRDVPVRRSFYVEDAVNMSLELCRNALKYGIRVEVSIEEDLPDAFGDQRQIEQVLVNLITNAAHAMQGRDKDSLLQIGVENVHEGIEFRIRDNGTGMAPAVLDKIFDPFFTTKAEKQGTGLGLSVSRGIIEEHGGRIRAESREGEGTEFTFTVPSAKGNRHMKGKD